MIALTLLSLQALACWYLVRRANRNMKRTARVRLLMARLEE
jgi:type II secretory pathway component PulJ